jgi:hypothetical protein
MTAFQTFTTLILAGIGAYIAWRQWRTAQDRLILDLFERRFQVFQDLTRTVSATFADKPNVEVQDITKFDTAIERALAIRQAIARSLHRAFLLHWHIFLRGKS